MPKGYAECPHCKKEYAGPRRLQCPHCGKNVREPMKYNTEEVKAATRKVRILPEGLDYPNGEISVTHRPMSSQPPIRLRYKNDFPTDEELRDWANQNRQHMLGKNIFVDNQGLRWWMRQELNHDYRYKMNGDEMRYAELIINELEDVTYRTLAAENPIRDENDGYAEYRESLSLA